MNVYEVIGEIVVWAFVAGAGAFALIMLVSLILGIIDSIRKDKF